MASRYEVEVTITSAHDLKNVNWRNGSNRPYAVAWVDPANMVSTCVDYEGDTSAVWDQTLSIPLQPDVPYSDQTLFIDIVHANAEENTKSLIGSAKLSIREFLEDKVLAERVSKSVVLKRPSGRPQGRLEVVVVSKENRHLKCPACYGGLCGYQRRDPYYAPPYGVPPPPQHSGSRDYYAAAPPAYGTPYAQPYGGAPPAGYSYSAPPPPTSYEYGYRGKQPVANENESKFGLGTGIAVGAVAGVLGGLALAEGVDALEDSVAEKVEEDLAYDDF